MTENHSVLLSLYLDTVQRILTPDSWKSFLRTAAYNYKRDFDDQVLIYAQKPNATAVLSADAWERTYHREVLPEHAGISLFASAEDWESTKKIFDISDTMETADSIPVPIFKFGNTKEYTSAVLNALNQAFRVNESDFLPAIFDAADVAASEQVEQLMPEMLPALGETKAAQWSERTVRRHATRLIANSSAYMVALRCNVPADEVFTKSDFQDVSAFSTSSAISIGTAMSRAASEILQTVIMASMQFERLQSQKMYFSENRTFAQAREPVYNNDADKNSLSEERQADDNGNELLRTETAGLHQGKQTDSLHRAENNRQIAGAHSDNSAAGGGALGVPDRAEPSSMGIDRAAQSRGSDAVDRTDDQPSGDHAKSSASGADLQLKQNKPKKATGLKKTLPLFLSQEQVDSVFLSTFSDRKYRIFEQFQKKETPKENAAFLKKEYGISGHSSSEGLSLHYDAKGIEFTSADGQEKYRMAWTAAAKRIEQLMEANRYLLPAEVESYPDYRHRQAERQIRNEIAGEYRELVHVYNAVATEKLNQYVLIVGCMTEFQVGEHDITYMWHTKGDPIYPLIYESLDTIGKMPEFAERAAALKEAFQPYRTDLTEQEQPIQTEIRYEYHIGDQVYIGAQKYDVLAVQPDILLSDVTFPLLQVHYSKPDFEERLRENPMNEHLKVKYLLTTEKNTAEQPAQATPDNSVSQSRETPAEPTTAKPPVSALSTDCRNYHITDDALGVGTAKERFHNNISAIRVLRVLEQENRNATPDEQEILAKYVGWGGLSDAFDAKKENWSAQFQELSEALTPEEYEAARASVLTAFYTPPVVVQAIYKAIGNMGFKTGNVLDPACGTGNFFGMLPDSMHNSKLYGVEIDSLSGRIAQQLYPNAAIAVQGFEDALLPNSFFDVAVGNVPFGSMKVFDPHYNKLNFLIHDYFFAKTIDKVRPGGVIAFITSNGIGGGTMDKRDNRVRKYIAQRCDFLGAIRLPDDTFKKSAGTDMSTDILFLQKRERTVDLELKPLEWIDAVMVQESEYTDRDGNTRRRILTTNPYYQSHPEMVLGEEKVVSGPFGPQLVCKPFANANLAELLDQAIHNIHAVMEEQRIELPEEAETIKAIPADPSVRNFSYTILDGKIYFRENAQMILQELPKARAERVKGLISIRDCVRKLLEYQTEDYPDAEIKTVQGDLNCLYDDFTKQFGYLTARGNRLAFQDDSSAPLLFALEELDDEGNVVGKADIFSKRTIRAQKEITHVDTATEALAVSISERAKVDMAFMQALTGKDEQTLAEELRGIVFLNPEYTEDDAQSKQYLNADEYLSGNIRQKLAVAKAAAEEAPDIFSVNVEALEKVQPKDLTAAEISVQLNAAWLPEDVVNQFIYELLDTPITAQEKVRAAYNRHLGEWKISNRSYDAWNIKAYRTYGTKRAHAYRIIEDILNSRDTRIFDTVTDIEGKEKSVLNAQETAIAQGKQDAIKQAFSSWIWKDQERRHRLCKLYNETFNSIRPREYNGQHIRYHGMNTEIQMRPHQNDAVAHMLYGNNVLLAHVVGAGKTFEMIAGAMESKYLGFCQKSIFVVPNHITEQWAGDFMLLYPNANILVTRKADFQKENRKRFCSKIATGEYDAIIIGQSQFEKIPMSSERQEAMLRRQISELVDGIESAEAEGGEHFSVKAMERSKCALEDRLKRLTEQSRKDDVVTFEELGVDKMFVDEAHYYKNLFLVTKMRNVAGIAQSEAQKSSDMFMKCQYLDEITDEKGVVFATGTPISNSMVELYTMQRYLQYSRLRELGLERFDEWASIYGEKTTEMELAPEGTGYRFKTRFAKFNNLPELMSVFKEAADIRTADMLNLPVPKANYHNVVVQPSVFQQQYIESLAERAGAIHNRLVEPYEDNMLKVTNEGRKLALDERLIDPQSCSEAQSKADACAANVFRIWTETSDTQAAQLVFCDLSTPNGNGEFNVYDALKQLLVDKGIPEDEIAYIHNAKSETQKKNLFAQVRSGKIRVLIGSTQKMGAGTNVQERLIALHHLDCPWRPSDLEQREGRIIRQGNGHDAVEIYRYVTEATFDSYMWQLVEKKQRFIAQIMTSKSPVRSAEDVDETSLSYGEVKALASGNPAIMEKCALDAEVSRLNLQKANFLNDKYELEDRITQYFPMEIAKTKERITKLSADIQLAAAHTNPQEGMSPMTINGTAYTERVPAGEMLISICKELSDNEHREIGTYRGFRLLLSYVDKKFYLDITNKLVHVVVLGADPLGNIRRVENEMNGLDSDWQSAADYLADLKKQLATAQEEVKKEFPHEQLLAEKTEKLGKLNALLTSDVKHLERQVEAEPVLNGQTMEVTIS